MGKGIMKRRHRAKMNKQAARAVKLGKRKSNNAHKRRLKKMGLWSPNPKGK